LLANYDASTDHITVIAVVPVYSSMVLLIFPELAMKRRDMLKKSAIGAVAASVGAPAVHAKKDVEIPTKPKPIFGEMSYRTLGKTGIKVSRLGFGSHLLPYNRENPVGRDRQIQEGFANGMNLFDVYDHGGYKQFAPMAKSLADKRKDVVISLVAVESDVRKEVEGALRTFKSDYIDLYRIVYRDGKADFERGDDILELMLKMKEEGKIRAVGCVAHRESGLLHAAEHFPIDYVMMPINFHHNKAWFHDEADKYSGLMPICREKNLGILGIKPMAGDPMVAYAQYHGYLSEDYRGASYPKAALRHLWENDDIASVMPTFNSIGELWDDLESLWQPALTKEDKKVLKKLSKMADKTQGAYLPEKYKWMEEWRVRTV